MFLWTWQVYWVSPRNHWMPAQSHRPWGLTSYDINLSNKHQLLIHLPLGKCRANQPVLQDVTESAGSIYRCWDGQLAQWRSSHRTTLHLQAHAWSAYSVSCCGQLPHHLGLIPPCLLLLAGSLTRHRPVYCPITQAHLSHLPLDYHCHTMHTCHFGSDVVQHYTRRLVETWAVLGCWWYQWTSCSHLTRITKCDC